MTTFRINFYLFIVLCFVTALPSWAKQFLPDHPRIYYQGRIDFNETSKPQLVWQGTTVEFTLKAQKLYIGFADVTGQVFFDLDINGKSQLLKVDSGWHEVPLAEGVKAQHIKLFKRSEADKGRATFIGLKTDDKASLVSTKRKQLRKRFIFYGDSITVGACNEDGDTDQWEDYSTHNNRLSYGALTAEELNADYRNIAVSGMGISIGYVPLTAAQVWNRFSPSANAKIAMPDNYKPQIVFVNFGENDNSYTAVNKLPFPEDFTERYVALIKDMRKSYPKSHIVILRGGMAGGKHSERLIVPWKKVVSELEKNDHKIHHYIFENWYHLHPRVKHHRAMADELSAWLLKQQWFKRLY